MDAHIRNLYRQAQTTDAPVDWQNLCSVLERYISEDLYPRIILQFRTCPFLRRGTQMGRCKISDWCPHDRIRVLGISNVPDEPPLNPLWDEPCEMCGEENSICGCGDNPDLYTCDTCEETCLVADTTPIGRDENVCQDCFIGRGVFRWREMVVGNRQRSEWLDPINNRWTKFPMHTLLTLKEDTMTWPQPGWGGPGSRTTMPTSSRTGKLYDWKSYANALAASVEFISKIGLE